MSFAVSIAMILPYAMCLTPVKPISDWMVGSANHFGAPKDHPIDPLNPVIRMGGCSYGELDPRKYPYYNVVAIHPDSELLKGLKTNGCGACFEVQCIDRQADRCVNGPQTNNVVVVNSGACSSGCGGTMVNLHTFAFDKIAAIKYGSVQTRIRQVQCEPYGFLEVKVRDYRVAQGGYLKLTVRNVPGTGGIEKLELKGKENSVASGAWLALDNTFGAAFEMSELPDPPFDLRVTATVSGTKQQVVLRNVIKKAGFTGEIVTNVTFPGIDPFPKAVGQSTRIAEPPPAQTISAPVARTLPPSPSPLGPSPNGQRPLVNPDDIGELIVLVPDDSEDEEPDDSEDEEPEDLDG